MTALDRITIVVPSDRMEGGFYPQLRNGLEAHFKNPVVLQPWSESLPGNGALLIHRYGTSDISRGEMSFREVIAALSSRMSLATRARTILMDMARSSETLTATAELGLAGAVDEHDCWVGMDSKLLRSGPGYESGMCGLQQSLLRIGCQPIVAVQNYCKATMGKQTDLAELLSDYLNAYWETSHIKNT